MGLLGINMYPIENISIADLWLLFIILRVILKGKIAFGKREIFVAFTFFIALPIFGVLASQNSFFSWGPWLTNVVRCFFYGLAFYVGYLVGDFGYENYEGVVKLICEIN